MARDRSVLRVLGQKSDNHLSSQIDRRLVSAISTRVLEMGGLWNRGQAVAAVARERRDGASRTHGAATMGAQAFNALEDDIAPT